MAKKIRDRDQADEFERARQDIPDLLADLSRQAARIERLEVALKPLVEACEQDFFSELTENEPDDEPVMLGDEDSLITFGLIRNARAALSPAPPGPDSSERKET